MKMRVWSHESPEAAALSLLSSLGLFTLDLHKERGWWILDRQRAIALFMRTQNFVFQYQKTHDDYYYNNICLGTYSGRFRTMIRTFL